MRVSNLLMLVASATPLVFGQTTTPTTTTGGIFGSGSDLSRTVTLEAQLSPLNENPAVTTRAASGKATITIRLDRTAATSTTASSGSVSVNIEATTTEVEVITAAHIHRGRAGVNGPVVLDFQLPTSTSTTANQAATLKNQFAVTSPEAVAILAEIVADPQAFYANVHTMSNPNGHIRGQLAGPVSASVERLEGVVNKFGTDLADVRRLVVLMAFKEGIITIQERDMMLKAATTVPAN